MSTKRFLPATYEVNQVATLTNMSVRFWKDAIKDPSSGLVAYRLGNRLVIEAESLNKFLEARKVTK
jgi:hypothetical protein